MDQEQEKKLAELRALIDEGDRDVTEGRVKTYSRGELAAEVIARVRARRKTKIRTNNTLSEQSEEPPK